MIMKKHSYKLRNILTGLFATIVTFTLALPAMANNKSKAIKAALTPVVSYLGSEHNNPLFSVELENETPAKFEISIRDTDGSVLYKEIYEASKFSKVFKLVNEEKAIPAGLTFRIRELNTGVYHNFEVSTSTELVRDVEISKL